MLKKIVTLSFLLLFSFVLSISASEITPAPIEFDIKFLKEGVSDFGFYYSSEENEKRNSIEFEFYDSSTSIQGYPTPEDSLYIKWKIYEPSFKLSLIAQSSYDEQEEDFCIVDISNKEQGLNYSVIDLDIATSKYLIDNNTEANLKTKLPISDRSCELANVQNGSTDTSYQGVRNIQLLIHGDVNDILNGEYTGYLILKLTINN